MAKNKRLSGTARRAEQLAKSGRISDKQMTKHGLRGSQISTRKPRGGVGRGMAGA